MPSVSFFFIYLCVLYMLCIQHTVCISYSLYNMVITENCVWLTAFATRMIGSSAVLSSVEPRLRNRKCCGNPTINLEAEPSWQLPFFLYVYYVSPEFFVGGGFRFQLTAPNQNGLTSYTEKVDTKPSNIICVPLLCQVWSSSWRLGLCVGFFSFSFLKVGKLLPFWQVRPFSGRKIKPKCKANRFNLVDAEKKK